MKRRPARLERRILLTDAERETLRHRMFLARVTQRDLAAVLRISQSAVSRRYALGGTASSTETDLSLIAAMLRVPRTELLTPVEVRGSVPLTGPTFRPSGPRARSSGYPDGGPPHEHMD